MIVQMEPRVLVIRSKTRSNVDHRHNVVKEKYSRCGNP